MKKLFRTYWPLVLMLGGLFVPQVAFAAETLSSGQVMQNTVNSAITLVNTGIGILQFLIWPLLAIAGDLLTNDFIFGAGMEDQLLSLWQQMRNIVNLLFVVVLLVIAFANILGLGQENKYAIKKMMPRFVISLLLVNFSFFAIKVLVDVSNVMTTALMGISGVEVNAVTKWPSLPDPSVSGSYAVTLPGGTQKFMSKDELEASTELKGFNIQRAELEIKMCNPLFDKTEASDPVLTASKAIYCEQATDADGLTIFTGYLRKSMVDGLLKEWSIKNATLLMAVNLMNINQVNLLKTDKSTAPTGDDAMANLTWLANTLMDLLMKTGVSLVLLFVFGTAVIALIAVLFVRVIVVWNILVLSPLIALKAFIPEGVTGSFDIQKTVIKHITAPVIIAASMGIGFVMLNGLRTAYGLNTSATMSGSAALTDVKDLAIIAGAVLVIWKGVEEASKDTFAQTIVKTAQDTVKSVGSFAGKAVTYYAPIIPAGKKGEQPLSLATALGGLKGVEGQLTSAINRQQSKLSSGLAQPVLQAMGLEPSGVHAALAEAESFLAIHKTPSLTDAKPVLRDIIGRSEHGELNSNEKAKKILTDMFTENPGLQTSLGLTPADLKLLDDGRIEDFLARLETKANGQLFDGQTLSQFRTAYKASHPEDGSTPVPSPAAGAAKSPTPMAAVATALTVKDAKVPDIRKVVEAQATANPDDKKATALKGISDDDYGKLVKVKSPQARQQILETAVKDDGNVDTEFLRTLADAITKKDTAALVTAIQAGKIQPEEAKRIIELTEETEISTAEKARMNGEIDAAVTPSPGGPAAPTGVPTPPPPASPAP